MALAAGHRHVPAREQETRLLVPGQRKSRWPVSVQRVALLALIQVGCGGKLASMPVAVTVRAELELDLVESVFSLRSMTLHALQARVSGLQRVGGGRMFLDPELRRFPSVHGVTGRALASVGPLRELSSVRIGLVAIHALIEGDRLLEVALRMTLHAFHLRMLAQQRVLCLRVIEIRAQSRGDLLPARRRVA